MKVYNDKTASPSSVDPQVVTRLLLLSVVLSPPEPDSQKRTLAPTSSPPALSLMSTDAFSSPASDTTSAVPSLVSSSCSSSSSSSASSHASSLSSELRVPHSQQHGLGKRLAPALQKKHRISTSTTNKEQEIDSDDHDPEKYGMDPEFRQRFQVVFHTDREENELTLDRSIRRAFTFTFV